MSNVRAGSGRVERKLSKRGFRSLELVLLVSVFALFAFFGTHLLEDSKYSILLSEYLLHDASFHIDSQSVPHLSGPARPPGYSKSGYPYQLAPVGGKLVYVYPSGGSVLSLPFVALMNAAGVSALTRAGHYDTYGERFIQAKLAALLMAVLTVIFFRTALLLLPPGWSLGLALGTAFSTQIWSIASRVLWSHTWQIFLLGIAVYLLLSAEERRTSGRPVLLATLLAWAYFARPTSAIPITAISVYLALCRREEFIAFASTGALWAAAFAACSMRVYGHLLPPYYLFGLSAAHMGEALAADLISPSRGLFVFAPAALFTLLLVAYYRQKLPHLRLAVLSLVIIAAHLVVISADPFWWGGQSYGARLTTDLVPWFYLLAILGCRCLRVEPQPQFRRAAIALGMLTLLAGAFTNGTGALSRSANDWVKQPNIDSHPDRVWDWSNPQFLAGIHRPDATTIRDNQPQNPPRPSST